MSADRTGRALEPYPSQPEPDSIDFRTTWLSIRQSCRAHKMLIGLTCAFSVLFMIVYIVVWPPVYASAVTLAGESDRDESREAFYQTWNIFRKDSLTDEVYLISTRPVVEDVVEKLNLTDDDVHHSPLSYVGKLWGDSWVGKGYRAIKRFFLGGNKNPYGLTEAEIDRLETIRNFQSGVKLETFSDSTIGRLVVKGPSPRVAEMANTLAASYLEHRRQRYVNEADAAFRVLSEQAQKADTDLIALEQRMKQYYRDHGLAMTPERDTLDLAQWGTLRGAIAQHETAIAEGTATLAKVQAQLAGVSPESTTNRLMRPSSARQSLLAQIAQAELARKQLLIHYKPEAAEVVDLDQQLAALRAQLAAEPPEVEEQRSLVINDAHRALEVRQRELEADLAGHRAALAAQRSQAANLTSDMRAIPERAAITHEFDRARAELEKRYVLLVEKMEAARISRDAAASAPQTIRIVEQASVPQQPIWPKAKLMIPGAALLGLGVGVALALLADLLGGRVNRYRFANESERMGAYAVLVHDRRSARTLSSANDEGLDAPSGQSVRL